MVELQVGAYNQLPHYIVIGQPTDFYVFVNEHGSDSIYTKPDQGASQWIKGRSAFAYYNRLRNLHANDKPGFIKLVKQLREEYAWPKRA